MVFRRQKKCPVTPSSIAHRCKARAQGFLPFLFNFTSFTHTSSFPVLLTLTRSLARPLSSFLLSHPTYSSSPLPSWTRTLNTLQLSLEQLTRATLSFLRFALLTLLLLPESLLPHFRTQLSSYFSHHHNNNNEQPAR